MAKALDPGCSAHHRLGTSKWTPAQADDHGDIACPPVPPIPPPNQTGAAMSRASDASWLIVDTVTGPIVESSMESGSIHNPILVSFLPIIRKRQRIRTVQSIFVNVTSHPVSHSFTTDKSDYAANPGTICPNLAFAGSCGTASVQV